VNFSARWIAAVFALATIFAFGVGGVRSEETPVSPIIGNGSTVRMEYTLRDEAGNVLDSNKGRDALTYIQGRHQIVPGLEQSLEGMRAEEEKRVTVMPKDGYGPVAPAAEVEVRKDNIPRDALQVGTQLIAQGAGGQTRMVRVKEIKEQTVILDLNHPLAGKPLYFDIRILKVDAPAKP